MNKTFLIAWVVVFIVWMAGSFIVHGTWLSDIYATMAYMMRTEEDSMALFHFLLLAHVLMAGAFVWIYQRGIEDKSWIEQGLRFGVAVAILAPISTYMIYYTVQIMPGELAVRQIIGDAIVVIVCALVAAFLSRNATRA